MAGLLDDLEYKPWDPLPGRDSRDYYERRMNAGDTFRATTGIGASMAALAVREVVKHRSQQAKGGKPVAYLLRSLKHPDEVKLLRQVYGEAFSLVGVASTAEERRKTLSESYSPLEDALSLEAERLVARDESDSGNRQFGQNVRDTYFMADVFVSGGAGMDVSRDVDRYVDSVFGFPFLTPGPHEEGMWFAQGAALRSGAPARQVGVALIPKIGTPVVAGTNEVPRPGGGQYWDGDRPDHRDFRGGQDPNPNYIKGVVQELLERLAKHDWLVDHKKDLPGPALVAQARQPDDRGSSVLGGARASALIEFTRCLHAEQAAIINAARSGVSTQDAILYSTTFPCHECAKMIIGAGIVEVHYIEPYPKSLVDRLYRHLIDTSPPVRVERGLVRNKVPFYQFLGIAPRHYSRAFTAGERKTDDSLVAFKRNEACPSTPGWSATAMEQAESVAVASISRIVQELATGRAGRIGSADGADADLERQAEPTPTREAEGKRRSRS
ncbi:MAG: deaminase [Acidobacteria bacterium]|nr:deaminase [Acidobacteriota bacterium]